MDRFDSLGLTLIVLVLFALAVEAAGEWYRRKVLKDLPPAEPGDTWADQ